MVVSTLANAHYKYTFGANTPYAAPFERLGDMRLFAARGDQAHAQLLLFSDDEMMASVNADPLFFEGGPIQVVRVQAVAPDGIGVKLNLIGLIADDDGQLKSDIVMHAPYIRLPARKLQQVLVELSAPLDATPGQYEIELLLYTHSMFEPEVLLDRFTLRFEVIDYALPPRHQRQCYLDLWQHNCNIARKYGVGLWTYDHFRIMEQYVASLAELGQSAVTLIASDIPWSGQFCTQNRVDPANLFEYNMARVYRGRDGLFRFDFSVMGRYIKLCAQYGIDRTICVFGLLNIWVIPESGYAGVLQDYPDDIRIRYLDEVDGCHKYMRAKDELFQYIRALWAYFVGEGLTGKVRIFADEPPEIEVFKRRSALLHEAVPDMKLMVAINRYSFIEEHIEGIQDYVPWLGVACKDYKTTQTAREQAQGLFLFYTMGPSCPDSFVGSHLIENRITLWLSWFLGMDGFLRWNYTVWSEQPYKTSAYLYPRWRAGDCFFVYPGAGGVPELSLRWVFMKKAMRDFELFSQRAKTEEQRGKLMERMRQVFLWNTPEDIHPSSRKACEELFSLDADQYDEIIYEVLTQLAGGAHA